MKLLLVLLTLATALHADPPNPDRKTRRMVQIEAKYNVAFHGILRTDAHEDYWIFMESQPLTTFGRLPIVISSTGTDHDFEVARVAAENATAFSDAEIRRAKALATPTPTSTSFTMPTKPNHSTL